MLIQYEADESIYNYMGLTPWQCLNVNIELIETSKKFLREFKKYKSMKSLKSNKTLKSHRTYKSYRSFKTSKSRIEFQKEYNENLLI